MRCDGRESLVITGNGEGQSLHCCHVHSLSLYGASPSKCGLSPRPWRNSSPSLSFKLSPAADANILRSLLDLLVHDHVIDTLGGSSLVLVWRLGRVSRSSLLSSVRRRCRWVTGLLRYRHH